MNKWDDYSNKELIELIKEKYLNGELNRYKNLGTKTNTPDLSVLQRRFNIKKWSEFLILIGLKKKVLTKEEKIKYSIKELQELAKKLNKCPTVEEYNSYKTYGYVTSALQKNTNMKYNDLCRKYIPQYDVNLNKDLTKEKIIAFLTNLKNELGRTPMCSELRKYGFKYDVSIINRKFNMTYNEVIESLNWKIEGWQRNTNTNKELLDMFNDLFIQKKRIPTRQELDKEIIGGYDLYTRKFGSIYNVCEKLNIKYNESNIQQNKIGKICFDDMHRKCNSIIECEISNLLIANNIKNNREIPYSKLIKNGKNRRFDWEIKLSDKFYYIEYAGLYNKNSNSKISVLYRDKIKNKIKDLKKNRVMNSVLFIYPEDDYKDKLEKFLKIKLKKDIDEYERITIYSSMTDFELGNIVMKYSNNKKAPKEEIIRRKNQELFYEIHLRYKHYFDFCETANLKLEYRFRYKNYWNEEQIFKRFLYIYNKYGYIITTEDMRYSNDEYLRGLNKILLTKRYRFVKIRLKFWEKYASVIKISKKEKIWLSNVKNNKGVGIKNKVTIIQQKQAESILSLSKRNVA